MHAAPSPRLPSVQPTRPAPTPPSSTGGATAALLEQLGILHAHMVALEGEFAAEIQRLRPSSRASGRNLIHYMALRQFDLREVQAALAPLGLSSLGRLEGHALAGVQATMRVLSGMADRPLEGLPTAPVSHAEGAALLASGAEALLGPGAAERSSRIMVTMATSVADDPRRARRLLEAGMDVARINGAHDDAEMWSRMIANIRLAEDDLRNDGLRADGHRCRILVDLPGPKLRTGRMARRPGIVRWRPVRDRRGVAVAPAVVALAEPGSRPPPGDQATVPVAQGLVDGARVGDVVRVVDCRGRRRALLVSEVGRGWLRAITEESARVEEGAKVTLRRRGRRVASARVAGVSDEEAPLSIGVGSELVLDGAIAVADGRSRVPCTMPEVLADVRRGDPVILDDGRFVGTAVECGPAHVRIRIDHAPPDGGSLRGDKGINLPASPLRLAALTETDVGILRFAAQHADLVGLSFVRSPEDVRLLHRHIDALDRPDLGVLLKIETRQGFERLPRILLAALERPPTGVMVARGDLAVEVGFERLAELQEEILWFAEAAHVPVVWATQVLESLARTGMPSRAEVTDAAMAVRAECVMLNKGPYIAEAVGFLDHVLRRMSDHQQKKRATLRRLGVAVGG